MFENLSQKLYKIFSKIRNYGRLTETNIQNTLDEVYTSLLEADVSIKIIKIILQDIKSQAIGKKINNSFTPGQELLMLVQKSLIKLMGTTSVNINLSSQPPVVIMLVGLQGSGKTTSVIKLAYFLKKKYKKKVIVTSVDIYRPAAREQLKILAHKIKIDIYENNHHNKVFQIIKFALLHAKINFYDILIIDTAGRLHIDNVMMNEIKNIYNILKPIENLFVIDAMTGQDAIISAQEFNQYVPITGIFLTKVDSDTRGGAALSAKYIIKKPIKFIGTGEKINKIEIFDPKIITNRILGMKQDFLSIKDIKKKLNDIKNQQIIQNINKRKSLSLYDFLEQLQQIEKFGSNNIINILNKFKINQQQYLHHPIMNIIHVKKQTIRDTKIMMDSMTHLEKINVEILNISRKKRIALGSGISLNNINNILKQYNQIKLMTKKIKNNNKIRSMLNNITNFFSTK
ncbi:signal recognition particle protein [Enterobacteriaceae endosymbiont of Neohaemonia nigricornis]|uniref:signal recognition particle protein n=1 Tax=Enterobacteriaceae endosymbiont of Neohaemonia nigricornis TaxID=2675792 RepID=UPI001449F0BF|nr:signal recognition particle receptor subunit alpha [Enterobacteriaceae endosymbiont of Neohaemonia nigricornis]QJC30576.1 signal recognition particle protein [Enterobacteriaceae endosymbiont of Neohaemonia nigricornis]